MRLDAAAVRALNLFPNPNEGEEMLTHIQLLRSIIFYVCTFLGVLSNKNE